MADEDEQAGPGNSDTGNSGNGTPDTDTSSTGAANSGASGIGKSGTDGGSSAGAGRQDGGGRPGFGTTGAENGGAGKNPPQGDGKSGGDEASSISGEGASGNADKATGADGLAQADAAAAAQASPHDAAASLAGDTRGGEAHEDAAHAGGGHDGGDGSHALDQSAIDAMLGNAFSSSALREESGMERIIKAGFVAYERMPMLENVFDRLVRFLSSTLRGFTNDNVDITMENMRSLRFGDYMAEVPSSSLFSVFRAEQWKNYGLVVVDSALSYSIVDILMGGERGGGPKIIENRPHTALERALIEKLIVITLADLSEAFAPVGKVDLIFERLEISSSLAVIARPSNAAVAARFHIDMGDRSGDLDIVLPYATLEPVREKLSQQFMGESFGNDSIWENHLISEIMETNVTVSTVFESASFPLSQILALQKGSVLQLPSKGDAPHRVRMECDGTPVFEGTLGRLHNMQAVRIDQRLIPLEEELTPELLASLKSSTTDHHPAEPEGYHVSAK